MSIPAIIRLLMISLMLQTPVMAIFRVNTPDGRQTVFNLVPIGSVYPNNDPTQAALYYVWNIINNSDTEQIFILKPYRGGEETEQTITVAANTRTSNFYSENYGPITYQLSTDAGTCTKNRGPIPVIPEVSPIAAMNITNVLSLSQNVVSFIPFMRMQRAQHSFTTCCPDVATLWSAGYAGHISTQLSTDDLASSDYYTAHLGLEKCIVLCSSQILLGIISTWADSTLYSFETKAETEGYGIGIYSCYSTDTFYLDCSGYYLSYDVDPEPWMGLVWDSYQGWAATAALDIGGMVPLGCKASLLAHLQGWWTHVEQDTLFSYTLPYYLLNHNASGVNFGLRIQQSLCWFATTITPYLEGNLNHEFAKGFTISSDPSGQIPGTYPLTQGTYLGGKLGITADLGNSFSLSLDTSYKKGSYTEIFCGSIGAKVIW